MPLYKGPGRQGMMLSVMIIIPVIMGWFIFVQQAQSVDNRLLESSSRLIHPDLTVGMKAVSFLGSHRFLVPANLLLIAFLFFRKKIATKAYLGIGIALIGSALLFYFTWKSRNGSSLGDMSFAWYCILATIFYGLNVNMVNKVLGGTHPVAIGVIAFAALLIPAGIVLYGTGYFSLPLGESKYIIATVASVVLGIFGTTVASVLFYYLIQRAGYLFASLVTYGIPFIAQFWGWINGEKVDIYRILGLLVILGGIYLATQVKKEEQ